MLAHISMDGAPEGLFYIWLYSSPNTVNEERHLRAFFNDRKDALQFLRDYKVTEVEFSSKLSLHDRGYLLWLAKAVL